jgi:PAS domain S-box-containing protein
MFRRSATFLAFLGLFFFAQAGTGLCRETLTIGVRALSPPLSFLAVRDGQKVVRGYSIDELTLIGKILGVDIRFKALHGLKERRRMLLKGETDILAHSSADVARALDADFIPVGISLRHHLYVNHDCRSVTCLRDLQSKKVVAIATAPYSPEVQLGDDVLWLTSPLEALTLVSQGAMDVFVAPSEDIADYLIDKNRMPNILKKGVVLGDVPLGILVPKGNPELTVRIRKAVAHLNETGVLAQLRDKWFGKPTLREGIKEYAKYVAIGSGAVGIVFIVIVFWNVLLKRRVEEVTRDLRRTEQRYRDLIESSPDMIFLVTEEGEILHANERARAFLLYPREETPNLQQLVTEEFRDEINAFLTKVFNDGCDKHELNMVSASAYPMEVEMAGRILQGGSQQQVLACLFARNVTERNRMEEELIQSERLGIIGKMAASLAHEINNPLGIIQANAEDLMFMEGESKDVKDGLSAIQRNAIRAGEITKGLLEAASPKPMSMEIIEVGALVNDALLLLGGKSKRQRVTVQMESDPLYIRGDERALQQVLVNLVFNSLSATEESGSIKILTHGAGEGDSQTVRIEVRDTGKGIARENLTRIFEPFFTSRKGGFGLGLFITRRMVQRLDGLIFAESEVGRGTSMFLEFPAVSPKEN